MIYVRSRRPIVTFGASALACALIFGLLAFAAAQQRAALVAAIVLGAGSSAAAGAAVWAGLRLKAWPAGRLAVFRDRLLVIQGRHEMPAVWGRIDAVTLGDPSSWPQIRMTDRLTIGLRNEPAIVLRPADFGLEAAACRDMVLRLRDETELRERLPEFDSARDLTALPAVAGDLFEPRF